jgi:hypothetical protein
MVDPYPMSNAEYEDDGHEFEAALRHVQLTAIFEG